MSVEITHRSTRRVLATGPTAREAVQKAIREGADLAGADLTDADLARADLAGADLARANLARADLADAYLTGADLARADLAGANLTGANLTGADLTGANLTRANLTRANLTGAYLAGVKGIEAIVGALPDMGNLDAAILAAVEDAQQHGHAGLDMSAWHTCETTHCRAGWAVHLSGPAGRMLEATWGTNAAAALIYLRHGRTRVPDWYASTDAALADIRAGAAA